MKPVIACELHGLIEGSTGHYHLEMTVLVKHEASGAPAGSRGFSSSLESVDFQRGIAVTRNSIYSFEPIVL